MSGADDFNKCRNLRGQLGSKGFIVRIVQNILERYRPCPSSKRFILNICEVECVIALRF